MFLPLDVIIIIVGSLLVSFFVTGGMGKVAILDHPTNRSSHTAPIPTSGGIGIIAGFLSFLAAYYYFKVPLWSPSLLWIIGGGIILGGVGFIDEIIEISFTKRLIIQLIIGGIVLHQIIPDLDMGQLRFWILLVLLGGFVNAYNFFDGLNGLAVTSALLACIFASFLFSNGGIFYLAFIPGLLGFLVWNLKGKIIQGDVGTLFTGFCLPLFLLLEDSFSLMKSILILGHLLFPMLWDISVTVGSRVLKKQPVTTPHKGFFFHKLNAYGWPHLKVTSFYGGMSALQGITALLIEWESSLDVVLLYSLDFVLYTFIFYKLWRFTSTQNPKSSLKIQ